MEKKGVITEVTGHSFPRRADAQREALRLCTETMQPVYINHSDKPVVRIRKVGKVRVVVMPGVLEGLI